MRAPWAAPRDISSCAILVASASSCRYVQPCAPASSAIRCGVVDARNDSQSCKASSLPAPLVPGVEAASETPSCPVIRLARPGEQQARGERHSEEQQELPGTLEHR